jgi:hypothetical protein
MRHPNMPEAIIKAIAEHAEAFAASRTRALEQKVRDIAQAANESEADKDRFANQCNFGWAASSSLLEPAAQLNARELYKSRYGGQPEMLTFSGAMEFAEAYRDEIRNLFPAGGTRTGGEMKRVLSCTV